MPQSKEEKNRKAREWYASRGIAAKKAAYEANRAKILAKKKHYYEKNSKHIRAKIAVYRKNNPEKVKASYVKHFAQPWSKERIRAYNRAYRGLPLPERPEPPVCECCGRPPNGMGKRMHLDHCHATGKFRGWLCSSCNVGIGALGDNLRSVLRAALYLELNGSET